MIVKRLGNNVFLRWKIKTQKNLADLKLSVFVKSPMSDVFQVNYALDGDEIITAFLGKDQRYIGIYSFILVKDYGLETQEIIDAIDAVKLVAQEPEGVEISETLEITKGDKGDVGPMGPSGRDGKSAYEIYLQEGGVLSENEWIKSLQGKSAYEIAVSRGYNGTEDQWLASLHGVDGINGKNGLDGSNGINGKSAYEIAVSRGYNGTEDQWLASLHGVDGINGKNGLDGSNGINGKDGLPGLTAYQLAVSEGYKGTQNQWLKSLKGKDGIDGKSAYEIAVSRGYNGTEDQWLASLHGERGLKGLDNYELARKNGFNGSLDEWIKSLKGADGKDAILDDEVTELSLNGVKSSGIYRYGQALISSVQDKIDLLSNKIDKVGNEIPTDYVTITKYTEDLKKCYDEISAVDNKSVKADKQLQQQIDALLSKIKELERKCTELVLKSEYEADKKAFTQKLDEKAEVLQVNDIFTALEAVITGETGSQESVFDLYKKSLDGLKYTNLQDIARQLQSLQAQTGSVDLTVEQTLSDSKNPISASAVLRAMQGLAQKYQELEPGPVIYGAFAFHYGFKVADAARFIVFTNNQADELEFPIEDAVSARSFGDSRLKIWVCDVKQNYFTRAFKELNEVKYGNSVVNFFNLSQKFDTITSYNLALSTAKARAQIQRNKFMMPDLMVNYSNGSKIKVLSSGGSSLPKLAVLRELDLMIPFVTFESVVVDDITWSVASTEATYLSRIIGDKNQVGVSVIW